MEDILSLYQRPLDPEYPLVCLDETSKSLHADLYQSVPTLPGQVARQDYSYARNGIANLFMLTAPLLNWRRVSVTAQHTKADFAAQLRQLVDEDFPGAKRIIVVCDNLKTHHAGALYENYPPAEARRIMEKLEFHYTPEHGSWLNIAEIELSALSRQCLARRIGNAAHLQAEVCAWAKQRNEAGAGVKWQFTADDARTKLRRLYPCVNT